VTLEAAKEVCGSICCGGKRKKITTWQNEDLRLEVRNKKEKWRKYLRTNRTEDYKEYKEHRNRIKELVTEATKKAWEEFGKFLEGNAKEKQKLFYRVIKNMRKEGDKDCPLKFVRYKEGRLLSRHKEIMERILP
jgi:hypothetical protein